MVTQEALSLLFKDAGPLMEVAEVEVDEDGEIIHIAVTEGLELSAELDQQRDCLVLSSRLGEPSPESTGRLYPLLLRTSDLWKETGGIRFGLFGTGGAVSMLWDLPLAALDKHKLAAAVMGFAKRTLVWRQVVASGLSEAAPDPAATEVDRSAVKV